MKVRFKVESFRELKFISGREELLLTGNKPIFVREFARVESIGL